MGTALLGGIQKLHATLWVAGLGDTSEPPSEWKNLYEMEGTEPQGAMAKAGNPRWWQWGNSDVHQHLVSRLMWLDVCMVRWVDGGVNKGINGRTD